MLGYEIQQNSKKVNLSTQQLNQRAFQKIRLMTEQFIGSSYSIAQLDLIPENIQYQKRINFNIKNRSNSVDEIPKKNFEQKDFIINNILKPKSQLKAVRQQQRKTFSQFNDADLTDPYNQKQTNFKFYNIDAQILLKTINSREKNISQLKKLPTKEDRLKSMNQIKFSHFTKLPILDNYPSK